MRRLGWPSLNLLDSADASSAGAEFHLHPHYRLPRPLDALLLKTQAGLDDFVEEQYAAQIAAILARWSSGLLQSPPDLSAIENVLSPNFLGASPRPIASPVVRSSPLIEVRRRSFQPQFEIERDKFAEELRFALRGFSRILTAEFQVAGIDAASMPADKLSPGELQTRIRYELVATGSGFYREQRIGHWQITWQPSASGEFGIRQWKTLGET